MSDKNLLSAQKSHHQMMKEMLTKIDIPVIDHIALEMASKRRFLKASMPEHFTANFVNVGIVVAIVLTVFTWGFAGSVWIAALIVGSCYVLLHKRMLWLMDRFYFLSKTPKFKRLMSESAKGLYTKNIDESGYDERFLKPVLLRYFTDGEITGLEFWNVTVEMGYAFRSEFHDTRMDINEVDDWFTNGKIDSLIPEAIDEEFEGFSGPKKPSPNNAPASNSPREKDESDSKKTNVEKVGESLEGRVSGHETRLSQSEPKAESTSVQRVIPSDEVQVVPDEPGEPDEIVRKELNSKEEEGSHEEDEKKNSEDASIVQESFGDEETKNQVEELDSEAYESPVNDSNIDFDSIDGSDLEPEEEFDFEEFTSGFEPDEGFDDDPDMDMYDAISSEVIGEEEK